jgi:hypothetical protein
MYGTIADWRTYATARGNAVPAAASDPDATAALTRAGDHIRTRYVIRFLADYDATLPEVEEAAYIAASLELATPGFFSAIYTPGQAKVLTEVKGIRWTPVEGGQRTGADSVVPVSAAIDALLAPYTRFGLPAVAVA